MKRIQRLSAVLALRTNSAFVDAEGVSRLQAEAASAISGMALKIETPDLESVTQLRECVASYMIDFDIDVFESPLFSALYMDVSDMQDELHSLAVTTHG